MQRFEPVDPKVNFPELERRILEFWREADVFARSIELRKDGPALGLLRRPPDRERQPGIHHVEARVFKDVYPRFKTMTGHFVPRKGGWDCHGLPVELEVEKEIGTTGKRDIEAFGIAEFNQLCRESVGRYVEEFERLTERIGFWIDMSDAYWTMNTEYIESVWWSLKRLHQRGLLVEADKVTAYCPRCGTALSDAEVAMGYQTVEDPSVFVRFPSHESANEALSDPRGLAARVDDDAVDACRRTTGSRLTAAPRTRWSNVDGELLVVGTSLARTCAGRGRRGGRDPSRIRPRRAPLRAAVSQRRGGAHGGRRRVRLDGRRHRDRAHGAGVRAGGPRDRASAGLADLQARGRRRAGSTTRARRSSAGSS